MNKYFLPGVDKIPKDNSIEAILSPIPATPEFILDSYKDQNVDEPKVQRSFYIQKTIWDAAAQLPVSRQEIIYKALLEAVSGYKSELPLLRQEIAELDQSIELMQIRRSAKVKRVRELEAAEEEGKQAITLLSCNKQQAAKELNRFLNRYGNSMQPMQFKRLEELSGIHSKKIKEFLEGNKYFPSDEEINSFFGI